MAVVNTNCPIITLTSDFGQQDNYVGIVKGVLLSINPKINIIDIANNVPSFNIEAASYIIETSFRAFPEGTIHLVVVDPRVGTPRNAIMVETRKYFFIGPDNGLFTFLKNKDITRAISLKSKKYFPKEISATFHGRDIFAPATAFLSLGISPEEFGAELKSIIYPKSKKVRKTKKGLIGTVIYIDRFGNLATSIKKELLEIGDNAMVFMNNKKIGLIGKTFASVKIGRPVCYINSFGHLEIGLNKGSAADYFEVDYSTKPQILIASE